MPASDLHLYQLYIARRGLPSRRLERLLAQVSLTLAQAHGADSAQLTDFLFDPPPPDLPPEQQDYSGFFD